MRRADGGFVLVNAVILVAAIAAVVVVLLGRADRGVHHLQARQEAVQLEQALKGYEALALTLLHQDRQRNGQRNEQGSGQGGSGIDHLAEPWAKPHRDLALTSQRSDQAGDLLSGVRISGQMMDQQALFNLNWLLLAPEPEDPSAFETEADAAAALHLVFDRLLLQQGLSGSVGDAIRQALRPARSTAGSTGSGPIGGPLFSIEQLRDLPGLTDLSPADDARLRQVVSVLPGDSALNINTVTAPVLAAFLPDLPPARRAQVLAQRDRDPFGATIGFLQALGISEAAATAAGLSPDRMSIGSDWILMQGRVRLGRDGDPQQAAPQTVRQAFRQALIWRPPLPATPQVVWRASWYHPLPFDE